MEYIGKKGGSYDLEKAKYYKREYERIVNRFKWNASGIYFGSLVTINLCQKEALSEIRKVYDKSYARGDVTGTYYQWAKVRIKVIYKELLLKKGVK
ncbi:hypothetical protein [Streptococcus sp. zg-JUN1979]|uniref:hypothetical protein n=1 Tax=Streptococcus sp. zg-JUN1979 TaxID=3391450 RepID=UPI0039A5C708